MLAVYVLSFDSREEGRIYGGLAFIEMQFCKMPLCTNFKRIVSVHNVALWKDVLYILTILKDLMPHIAEFFVVAHAAI